MTWSCPLPLQFSTTVAAFVVDEAVVTSMLTWQLPSAADAAKQLLEHSQVQPGLRRLPADHAGCGWGALWLTWRRNGRWCAHLASPRAAACRLLAPSPRRCAGAHDRACTTAERRRPGGVVEQGWQTCRVRCGPAQSSSTFAVSAHPAPGRAHLCSAPHRVPPLPDCSCQVQRRLEATTLRHCSPSTA